jgi:anti-sigma-K factor RskA
MGRGRARFLQSDVGRVLNAARKAGVECLVEIDPATGRIVISTVSGREHTSDNETERWLAKHANKRKGN